MEIMYKLKIYLRFSMVCLFMTIGLVAFAQTIEPNLKFDKPTEAELTMESYAPDPEAPAVILCSQTEAYYDFRDGDFVLVTTVKMRIKVLKDEGKSYANVVVPFTKSKYGSADNERVYSVKATSYNKEDGQLKKTKMSSDLVFTEKVDAENMLMKFTIPQVKKGTVIEYQYTKESNNYYYIDTWYAQAKIPTLYASYELNLPEWFKFNVAETGFYQMESRKENENMKFIIGGSFMSCLGERYSFVARELPALKDDKYIWCIRDYCNKVVADLRSIEIPGLLHKYIAKTWDNIGSQLMDYGEFGGVLKHSNPLKKEQAAAAIPNDATPQEKTTALFRLLNQHLTWNNHYGMFCESINTVMKNHEGSNAELNYILLSMLRDAGLKAYPVVLRLRNRGRLPMTHPSLKDLSTFVVGVMETDSTMFFIDSSAKDGGVNVLPPALLVDKARVIYQNGTGTWVNLQNLAPSDVTVTAQMTLSSDGTLKGKGRIAYRGNAALTKIDEFKEAKDSIDYTNQQGKGYGVKMHQLSFTKQNTPSLHVLEKLEFETAFEATPDRIYINPFLFAPVTESPFKDETRDIPVEYPYPLTFNIKTSFIIPPGYVVDEKPESFAIQTADGGIAARIVVKNDQTVVNVNMHYSIMKTFFGQTEYEDLCQFYESLTKKMKEIVVLKRKQ